MSLLLDRTAPTTAPVDPLAQRARLARNNRHDASAQQAYGLALIQAGRPDEALPWLEAAAALQPTSDEHQINLSAAFYSLGDLDRSLWHAERAHALNLANPMATFNIAALHTFYSDPAAAVPWFEKTIALDPQHFEAWSCLIFVMDFLATTSAEKALEIRQRFAATVEAPMRARWPQHRNALDPNKRLRIGFTGGDFRDHSAAYMFGPIYEHIDRERFQLVSYADQSKRDQVTDWFEQASNGWRDVTGWPEEAIAGAVYQDQIDILIDLAGFTDKSHLKVHMFKPAPLSVTAWGHLTGTGLQCMDGILVDDVILPSDRRCEVTEEPLYLPYALGFSGLREAVEITPRPEDRPLTFGYLGRMSKVPDEAIAVWADLLNRTPESRLIIKDGSFRHERVKSRIMGAFAAGGVDLSRIELRESTPRIEHLASYNGIDVALDTWPESGGCTSLESLWMGTPTVTMVGDRLISRNTASALAKIGHPDWVATTPDEYIAIAQRIAGHGGPALRDALLTSPVCDDKARTRGFEDAMRGLWQRYVARRKEA